MSAHQIVLGWHEWLDLFAHFLMLSMMSLGGAMSTSAEMHRYLVEQHGWLSQTQFNEAIALAQAAPGPNVLFVALMGWHVGLNAGSTTMALLGVAISMVGIMLPVLSPTFQPSSATNSTFGPGEDWASATESANWVWLSQPWRSTR